MEIQSYKPACLCTNLRRTARAISHIYDTALAPAGIKITQFSLLRAIERREPVAITELAEEVALDRTTLARNLSPLEREGLVERAPGDDQRVTEVRLTRLGRVAIRRALPLWMRTQKEVARLLTPARIEQIRDIAAEAGRAAATYALKTDSTLRKKKRRAG